MVIGKACDQRLSDFLEPHNIIDFEKIWFFHLHFSNLLTIRGFKIAFTQGFVFSLKSSGCYKMYPRKIGF